MLLQIANTISIIVIWQSLFFGIILLGKKFRKKSNNIFLGLILLTIGIQIAFIQIATRLDVVELFNPSMNLGFLYGPLIYLYIRSHLKKVAIFRKIDLLHFLPFVLINILGFVFEIKFFYAIAFLRFPFILIYCLYCLIEIMKYKKAIIQISSQNLDKEEIRLLLTILLITIYNVSVSIINFMTNKYFIKMNNSFIFILVLLGVFALVNFLVYQGIKKPNHFRKLTKTDIEVLSLSLKQNGVSKSLYNVSELNELSLKLKRFVENKQVFKNPDLDLKMLAESLEVHPRMLSQAINKVIGHNFHEFINNYRIEESKKLLIQSSSEKLTVKEIMYDVGFTSKSSFNTLFKVKTGLTPTEYRKNS